MNTTNPTHRRHESSPLPPAADCLIIGAGVIGLTTAILCREAGINAHIIAAHTTPNLTSERAAAFFHPYGFNASTQLAQWCADSYQRFTQLEATTPQAGIAFIQLREFHRTPGSPWWAHLVRNFRINTNPPPPFAFEYRATMPTIDMRRYLPWLMHRFRDQLHGTITTLHLETLNHPALRDAPTIINCTGLVARTLTNDPHLIAIRGQVLHVENTIQLNQCLLDDDPQHPHQPTYIVPFPDRLVLGGTAEPNQTHELTNQHDLNNILQRANQLLQRTGWPTLNGSRLRELRRTSGLRPARITPNQHATIRLERNTLPDGRTIIHHYGHGGAGITLAWGTALHARTLLLNHQHNPHPQTSTTTPNT